jgi:hypothetical protein
MLSIVIILFPECYSKKNDDDMLGMSSSSSLLVNYTKIRKKNDTLGVVVLLLFTYKLHKDNDVLGIIIVLFAKLHCTKQKKIKINDSNT